MQDIKEKLRKLLSLAERGIGGEKLNAETKLNALLKKHNLTLSDISDEIKEPFWFKYKGEFEKKLLSQVFISVAGRGVRVGTNRHQRSKLGAELTKCQSLEVDMLFDLYRVSLKEELELTLEAFVNRNNIFSKIDGDYEDEDPTKEELERALRVAERMSSVEKTEVQKRLK